VERLAFRFAEGWSWSRLGESVAATGGRAAIVGPHGTGKTTLIEEWADRLRSAGGMVAVMRFTEEDDLASRWRRLKTIRRLDSTCRLCVDGAEQLTWWEWWLWRRRTARLAGVVITRHRPGRLPCVYRCTTSACLLGSLLEELDAWKAAEESRWSPSALFEESGGNLRDAFRLCYDRRAGSSRPGW
jgi:hypothetical protein